ncbi:MAG: hypothetical protein ABSA48_07005 [Terracidiphilus sp.]|jgi:hypothetical protein
MKMGTWARLLLAAAPLLAGCGNFWQSPTGGSGSGGCTTNCSTATSGNFYILNAGSTPQVVGDSIVSGTLTAISGSPWAVESVPYAMAMAPNGNFLIVSTISGVYAYPISGGKLGTATVVSTDQAYAIQVDATNSWLVEAIPGTSGVVVGAVPINSTTGADNGSEVPPAQFAVANAALQQNKMVISPDNSKIFIALGTGGTLVVPFNATAPLPAGTVAITIPVVTTGGSALSVAVDPSTTPRLFYIGETLAGNAGASGGLRAFNYSSLGSGTLTQATGSPIATGELAPTFILPVSTPDYVYVANGDGLSAGNIAGFAITAASGPSYSIAAGSTIAVGVQPLGLAEDSTGAFVLEVGSAGSPYFDSFTFDATTTGKLDTQITSTTAADSIAIVAAP